MIIHGSSSANQMDSSEVCKFFPYVVKIGGVLHYAMSIRGCTGKMC